MRTADVAFPALVMVFALGLLDNPPRGGLYAAFFLHPGPSWQGGRSMTN